MSTVDPVTRSSSLYAMNRIHSSDQAGRGPGEVGGRFDQVALSSEPTGTDRFRMELVSRLSREIRSAVTTRDIQALRQQVSTGEYRPDAQQIAARMLLMGDVE